MRESKGFTLIELLIVIVMMGTIAGIGLPKIREIFKSRAVHGEADMFVSTHSYAKSTAVRFGRMSELHIDATGDRYWIEVDTSGTGVRDTVGGIRTVDDPVGLASNRSLLCFDSRGLATTRTTSAGLSCQAANANVVFSYDGLVDSVQTTALGKVLR